MTQDCVAQFSFSSRVPLLNSFFAFYLLFLLPHFCSFDSLLLISGFFFVFYSLLKDSGWVFIYLFILLKNDADICVVRGSLHKLSIVENKWDFYSMFFCFHVFLNKYPAVLCNVTIRKNSSPLLLEKLRISFNNSFDFYQSKDKTNFLWNAIESTKYTLTGFFHIGRNSFVKICYVDE